jgi:pilus assembly protein CpaC
MGFEWMQHRGIRNCVLALLAAGMLILPAEAQEQYKPEDPALTVISAGSPASNDDTATVDTAATNKTPAEKPVIDDNEIPLAVNSSQIVNFQGVERIAVANPEIADVIIVSGSEIMLVGKSPGTTTLHVWAWGGRQTYTIAVGAGDAPIAGEIKRILDLDDIRVTKAGKTVILEGATSDSSQRQRAEKIASAYADNVVNLLEITEPIQVKIEAKIVEINKTKGKEAGVLWGSDISAAGIFTFGQSAANGIWSNSLGKLGTVSEVNGQLSALVRNGAATILSQPSMVTVSGESANILVGGQIPIPMNNSNGTVTVEWKEYGIKLDIAPEVNSRGLITSKVKAEVSALDWSSAHQVVIGANLKIPPLTTRKAESSIALASGQTMVIGGLISRTDNEMISKLPLLGDLPVLGKLFTSKSFTKDETELIILITPTIVEPANYLPANSSAEMKKHLKD